MLPVRLKYLIIATAILGLSGLSHAAPVGEESATIDLSAIPAGSTYFLKCSRSKDPSNCGVPSLYEQTNGMPGLQSSVFAYGGVPRPADERLLA